MNCCGSSDTGMKSGSADKVVSFAAIWTVLVLCAFSVLGTLVLNKVI